MSRMSRPAVARTHNRRRGTKERPDHRSRCDFALPPTLGPPAHVLIYHGAPARYLASVSHVVPSSLTAVIVSTTSACVRPPRCGSDSSTATMGFSSSTARTSSLAHGPLRRKPLVRKTSTALDMSMCSKSLKHVLPSASTSREEAGSVAASRLHGQMRTGPGLVPGCAEQHRKGPPGFAQSCLGEPGPPERRGLGLLLGLDEPQPTASPLRCRIAVSRRRTATKMIVEAMRAPKMLRESSMTKRTSPSHTSASAPHSSSLGCHADR